METSKNATPRPAIFADPFELPPVRGPSHKLARNALCWCNSGLKYKRCHLARENDTPSNAFDIADQVAREFGTGRCLHPSAGPTVCDKSAIDAHTIQKRGGLDAIQEQKHVLTTKVNFQTLVKRKGKAELRRIGVNRASTFRGFCSKHDAEMFRRVEERSVDVDAEAAFLFSFRAVAYEKLTKEAAAAALPSMRAADKGRPLSIRFSFRQCSTPLKQG